MARPEEMTATGGRRGYPRLEASIAVELRFPGSQETVHGVTLNLSRGGMLANLGNPVTAPGQCCVQFPEPATALPDTQKACPSCGYRFPPPSIPGQTVKGVITRAVDRVGVTTAAVEFLTLLEVTEQ